MDLMVHRLLRWPGSTRDIVYFPQTLDWNHAGREPKHCFVAGPCQYNHNLSFNFGPKFTRKFMITLNINLHRTVEADFS
jgi:hypothetical protein